LDTSLFQTNKYRDQYIDALKGIAILLVVVGHAIQENISDFDNNIIFRIIYSFHMPLFMFISGYVIYGHVGSPLPIWLIDKFKRLVVPFLSWAIIVKFVVYNSDSFIQYFFELYKHPDVGLWFLWVLFLNYCLLGTTLLFGKNLKEVKLLLTIITLNLISISVLGFPMVRWLFPFFATGYILNEYRNKFPQSMRTLSILFSGAFPFLVCFWHRTKELSFNHGISKIFTIYDIVPHLSLIDISYRYIVAFAGISLVVQIIKKLKKYNYLLLSWLGTCTLDIYVSHQLFLWGIGEGIFRIISTIVISLLLSLALSFCLRQSKILSMLLLGRKYSSS
jgi:fucose 4-O-acetylase-like acetyltransferase